LVASLDRLCADCSTSRSLSTTVDIAAEFHSRQPLDATANEPFGIVRCKTNGLGSNQGFGRGQARH
jgi:hypothetical protein